VLPEAGQVGELEVDDLDVVGLDELEDFLRCHTKPPIRLGTHPAGAFATTARAAPVPVEFSVGSLNFGASRFCYIRVNFGFDAQPIRVTIIRRRRMADVFVYR
jgi:hypothetical protein